MDRESYLRLIEDRKLATLGAKQYTQELARRLERLEPAEIVSFEDHTNQLMHQINNYEVYDVLRIVEDYYAHDDGMWEFMQGLVALGQTRFEAVRDCPELIGEFDVACWKGVGRAPLAAARRAFEAATGTPLYQGYQTGPTADYGNRQGKPLKKASLQRKYPDLWYRFAFRAKRPAIEPAWLTANGGVVRKLAEALDAGRRFEDLPVLADALEEAGCRSALILGHCRRGMTHRGSGWVVNALLGKKEPQTMHD